MNTFLLAYSVAPDTIGALIVAVLLICALSLAVIVRELRS